MIKCFFCRQVFWNYKMNWGFLGSFSDRTVPRQLKVSPKIVLFSKPPTPLSTDSSATMCPSRCVRWGPAHTRCRPSRSARSLTSRYPLATRPAEEAPPPLPTCAAPVDRWHRVILDSYIISLSAKCPNVHQDDSEVRDKDGESLSANSHSSEFL